MSTSTTTAVKFLPASEKQRFKSRISLFYSLFAPTMMENVDKALTLNAPEQKVFSSLYTKYKVEPQKEEEAARRKGLLPKNYQPVVPPVAAAASKSSTTTAAAEVEKQNNKDDDEAASPDPRPPSAATTNSQQQPQKQPETNTNSAKTPKMTPTINVPSSSSASSSASNFQQNQKQLIKELSEDDKKRFSARFFLFYELHGDDQTDVTKVENNLKILMNSANRDQSNEDAIFEKLCTKYNISKQQELLEAGSKGLLPGSKAASSSSLFPSFTDGQQHQQQQQPQDPLPSSDGPMRTSSDNMLLKSPPTLNSGASTRPPTPNVRVVDDDHDDDKQNNNKQSSSSSSKRPTPMNEPLPPAVKLSTTVVASTSNTAPPTPKDLQQEVNKKEQEQEPVIMKNYSEPEKDRFKKRLRIFYEKNAPSMLANLDANVKAVFNTNNLEDQLMKSVCKKYEVSVEEEEKMAKENLCFPGMTMDKKSQQQQEEENKNESAKTSSDILKLKNLSQKEKDRIKKRLQLFYSRFAPSGLDKLDDNCVAIFKSDSTEEKLFEKLTTKYHVDVAKERDYSSKENLLPATTQSAASNTFTISSSRNATPKVVGSLPHQFGASSSTATFVDPDNNTGSRRGSLLQDPSSPSLLVRNYSEQEKNRFKKRMIAFYEKHQPESLKKLDDNLKILFGQKSTQTEEMVFKKLCEKYKVEVSAEAEAAKKAGLFFVSASSSSSITAARRSSATSIKSANSNNEESSASAMFMMKNYSESEKDRFRLRLKSFYGKHAPENLEKLESNLQICFKSERVEATLMENACKKYNVDPHLEIEEAKLIRALPSWQLVAASDDHDKNSHHSSTSTHQKTPFNVPFKDYSENEKARFKRRFVLFYQNHTSPENQARTDETLAILLRSDNLEPNIMKTLVEKYQVDPKIEEAEARQEGVMLGESQGPQVSVQSGLSVDLSRICLKELPPVERDRIRQRLTLIYKNHHKSSSSFSANDEDVAVAEVGKLMVSETMNEEDAVFAVCQKLNVSPSTEISEARVAGLLKSKGGSKTPSLIGTPKTPKLQHQQNTSSTTRIPIVTIKTPTISTLNANVPEAVGATVPDLSKSIHDDVTTNSENNKKTNNNNNNNESFSRTQSDALVEQARQAGINPPEPTQSQSPNRVERAWKDRLSNEQRALEYFNAMKNIQKEDVEPIDGAFDMSHGFNPRNNFEFTSPQGRYYRTSGHAGESLVNEKLPDPVFVGDNNSENNNDSSSISNSGSAPGSRQRSRSSSFQNYQQQQNFTGSNAFDRLTAAATPSNNQKNTADKNNNDNNQNSFFNDRESLSSVSGSVLHFGVEGGISTHLQFNDASPDRSHRPPQHRRSTLPGSNNNNNDDSDNYPRIPVEPIPEDIATASLISSSGTESPSSRQQKQQQQQLQTIINTNNNNNKNDLQNVSLSPPSRRNSVAASSAECSLIAMPIRDFSAYEKSRLRNRIKLFYQNHAPVTLEKLDENIQKLFDPEGTACDQTEQAVFEKMYSKYNVEKDVEEEESKKAGVYGYPQFKQEHQQQRQRATSVASNVSSTGSSIFSPNAARRNLQHQQQPTSSFSRTHLPPLPSYSPDEKERFRNRIILFYKNHFPEGMKKLDENLKKAFTFDSNYEEHLIHRMCAKYKIDKKIEYQEAKAQNLQHPPPTSSNNSLAASSQQHTPREFDLAKSLQTSITKPLVCVMTPEIPLHEYNKVEKARFKRRLTLFYETFCPSGLPKLEFNIEKLLAPPTATKKPTTEEQTMAHVCEKYGVDYFSQEVSLARKKGVFERVSIETPLSVRNLNPEEKERFKKRLTLFYRKYAPENIETVDKAAEFSATEEQVFRKVCEKYNVPERNEEIVAKVHNLWAPPASSALDELILQKSFETKQRKEEEEGVPGVTPKIRSLNTSRASSRRTSLVSATNPYQTGLMNSARRGASPLQPRQQQQQQQQHPSAFDESGVRPETLYTGASPDSLFSKFLQLSTHHRPPHQQQNISSPFGGQSFDGGSGAPLFDQEDDFSAAVTTTPKVPREIANFATPDLEKYFDGISASPASGVSPIAKLNANNSGYFKSSKKTTTPSSMIVTKKKNNTNMNMNDDEDLSPRAATAQKLLSALMDQLDIDVEVRNDEDALIQAAWGQKMTPERYKAHRQQLLENKIPRNVFPISTPDHQKQQEEENRSSPKRSQNQQEPSKFLTFEEISTPVPVVTSSNNNSKILSPPRRNSRSGTRNNRSSSAISPNNQRKKIIVGNQVLPVMANEDDDEEDQENNNEFVSSSTSHHSPPPGPVYDDELIQDSINERMASFLPTASEVDREERLSPLSMATKRSQSRSHSSFSPTKSHHHPPAFSFHTAGSLPCPSPELPCPLCGEEIDKLVVEETSTKAAEAFDPSTLADVTVNGPRVKFFDENRQYAGRMRSSSASSETDHSHLPRSRRKSPSASLSNFHNNFQTVSSHLDRCTKRRRSFEEQIFEINSNPIRTGGSKTTFERNAEEIRKQHKNQLLPIARSTILKAASVSSSISTNNNKNNNSSSNNTAQAHLLLAYLGELTAFTEKAKKFTNDLERHKTKTHRFFQQVEMYRLQNHRGESAVERNKQRTMNSNVYDQFLGMEVELFEEGTRLVHEKEILVKKSQELFKKLQLPCPMGETCASCVVQKKRSSNSRAVTPSSSSRRASPEREQQLQQLQIQIQQQQQQQQQQQNLGFLCHADVQDHSMFCWKAKFHVERCVPKYESFSNSFGFYHHLGMKTKDPQQQNSDLLIDLVPKKKGGTLVTPVDKSTETLWTLLAKSAPALVTRASNAPMKALELCVDLLDDDQDDLDEFFRASGMKPKRTMSQQTSISFGNNTNVDDEEGPASPRSVATSKLRRQLAAGAPFRGANAEISKILRECVGLGDEERFYSFDGDAESGGGEREMPLVKILFVRSYDEEVIHGNTPVWKCWWLDFKVFIV